MALTGKGLVAHAQGKIGTPYVYASKMETVTLAKITSWAKSYPSVYTASYITKAKRYVGKIATDCSGLISSYTGKTLGSAQLYSNAKLRIPIVKVHEFAVGTILWKDGHVGVYIGLENGIPMCIEAKGINYGTIKSKVADTAWKYGLTFDFMTYETSILSESTVASSTTKVANPYTEPTRTLKRGMTGNDVKWVQFELLEAGITTVKIGLKTYTLSLDGDYGKVTEQAVIIFQKSAKIDIDGAVGKQTRTSMKAV